MQFDALTLLQPLIKDGKLRALAVTTPTRWPDLPEVPTMRETGFADFPGNPWAGIMAPPNLPAPVVTKLNATLNDILRSPEAKESLAKLNVLLRPGSPEEFAAFVAKETPVWTEMVRESGATAQ
jgi:tripartite-type tricarboxylate transporter receptor subunit TctC